MCHLRSLRAQVAERAPSSRRNWKTFQEKDTSFLLVTRGKGTTLKDKPLKRVVFESCVFLLK